MALTAIHPPTEMPVPGISPPRGNGSAPGPREKKELAKPYVDNTDFSRSMIEANRMKAGHKTLKVAFSLVFHVLFLSTIILSSLWFTNVIDIKAYTQTLIVGPPPPPPPPPVATVVRTVTAAPKRVFFEKGKLLAPSFIPQQVAMLKEAQAPEEADLGGVAGGVPGGVPGGQMGGVIGGVIGGINTAPTAPVPVKKAPVRVGGRVKAPRPIYNPAPEYPAIAKGARVEGVVVIKAILDERGNVMEMSIVSGPPLLYKAALDAVAKWKYQPTYLNEEPIQVEMNIIVTFQLNG